MPSANTPSRPQKGIIISRSHNPPDPDAHPLALTPLELRARTTLAAYKLTDHPCIWVPSRTLWHAYCAHPLSSHPDDGGARLTPRQFGRVLARLYPDNPRVCRRHLGTKTRGIGGLCGPGSLASPGYADHPAHHLTMPPPDGWTPPGTA